jgi:UDP-N-acetylmuramate--alanine ligase
MIFGKIKELFFVGIGGSGMSGIAEVLHNMGYTISGSDLKSSDITKRLERLGIKVFYGHNPENIGTANVAVTSSAVEDDNPEIIEAKKRGIGVIKRAEMLGELMRLKYSVGIAGTHGKSTTTSMIGKILTDAGLDPTVIVGGIVSGKETGASLGEGEYLVAEADEYDRSFLSMYPTMAVVTNIEPDHLECFGGMDDLEKCFVSYMNRVPFYGLVIYSADDPTIRKLITQVTRPHISFGFAEDADYRADNYVDLIGGSEFDIFRRSEKLGAVRMMIPGQHNALNAMAALASAMELDVAFDDIAVSLNEFGGVSRRFEIKGTVNDIMVVDDFAHHPTEITKTLEAAASYNRRLVVIFQPHLYTRTEKFYREFAETLHKADIVYLVDIHPAREKPIEGVTSNLIAEHALKLDYRNIRYIGERDNAVPEVLKVARPGDMILTIGAGSVTVLGAKIIEGLESK